MRLATRVRVITSRSPLTRRQSSFESTNFARRVPESALRVVARRKSNARRRKRVTSGPEAGEESYERGRVRNWSSTHYGGGFRHRTGILIRNFFRRDSLPLPVFRFCFSGTPVAVAKVLRATRTAGTPRGESRFREMIYNTHPDGSEDLVRLDVLEPVLLLTLVQQLQVRLKMRRTQAAERKRRRPCWQMGWITGAELPVEGLQESASNEFQA